MFLCVYHIFINGLKVFIFRNDQVLHPHAFCFPISVVCSYITRANRLYVTNFNQTIVILRSEYIAWKRIQTYKTNPDFEKKRHRTVRTFTLEEFILHYNLSTTYLNIFILCIHMFDFALLPEPLCFQGIKLKDRIARRQPRKERYQNFCHLRKQRSITKTSTKTSNFQTSAMKSSLSPIPLNFKQKGGYNLRSFYKQGHANLVVDEEKLVKSSQNELDVLDHATDSASCSSLS